jgi:bifunctional ADP-heptose synthase (sugar kinase/adenylyltransferase)|tara:strand:- start:224 stop:970 length:747 start_codon:yes stop_codon:yes gene_type:complete
MKFLVIGESCSDRFCYGKAERLCPEAPAPVFIPESGVNNLGMASNVYRNILAIDESTNKGIPYRNKVNLFTNETEGHKTRYIDIQSNQMFLRVDTDSYSHCGSLPDDIEEYDAVIVSDYNKGFLTDLNLREIAHRSKLSFLDTKKDFNIDWSDHFTFIKINEKEFLENGWKHRAENVIVTKASKGCWYNHKDYPIKNPSDVRDVSGAGDTFLAAFSYSYTATKNVETAIIFSQDCCQRVIRKKGVTTI